MKISNINNNQTSPNFNAVFKLDGCVLSPKTVNKFEKMLQPIGRECDVVTFSTKHGFDKKYNIEYTKIKENHRLNLSDGREVYGIKEDFAYGPYDSRLEQIEYYITQRLREIINLTK